MFVIVLYGLSEAKKGCCGFLRARYMFLSFFSLLFFLIFWFERQLCFFLGYGWGILGLVEGKMWLLEERKGKRRKGEKKKRRKEDINVKKKGGKEKKKKEYNDNNGRTIYERSRAELLTIETAVI